MNIFFPISKGMAEVEKIVPTVDAVLSLLPVNFIVF